LAGSAALVLITGDLAAANARYVLTVPQQVFEARSEALTAIENAERADPAPGPFRIHRMPRWHPPGWGEVFSNDRTREIVSWERDTLHPKYAIDYGLDYTFTSGVAQLRDYERFFASFPARVRDPRIAERLNVKVGEDVLYSPRRAYDLWNTRYMIVPFEANGWRDPHRGYASFLFRSRPVYPDRDRVTSRDGTERARHWAETRDFQVIRNLAEYPRSWIVHSARPIDEDLGPAMGMAPQSLREILYAGDPIWNNGSQRTYDPRNLAWVSRGDLPAINPYLSGRTTRASETVTVRYPSPQQAHIEAHLDSPGLVILADVAYPGWELAIDGNPAPFYWVNGLMRGAAVSSGTHRLVYTYAPGSFRAGKLVSMAGLAVLLMAGLAYVRWPVEPALGKIHASVPVEKNIESPPRPGGW
jgi:hypothetical protein